MRCMMISPKSYTYCTYEVKKLISNCKFSIPNIIATEIKIVFLSEISFLNINPNGINNTKWKRVYSGSNSNFNKG